MTNCLNPLCQVPILVTSGAGRGLCRGCYAEARSLILRGDATWEMLEGAGLIMPSAHRGRRPEQSLLWDALCVRVASFVNAPRRTV